MACGAFHSLVVLGEASKAFRKVKKIIFFKSIGFIG